MLVTHPSSPGEGMQVTTEWPIIGTDAKPHLSAGRGAFFEEWVRVLGTDLIALLLLVSICWLWRLRLDRHERQFELMHEIGDRFFFVGC